MNITNEKVIKRARRYYPETLDVSKWNNIEPLLKELSGYTVNCSQELLSFIEKVSELQMLISEEQGRRYIKMTLNTENKEHSKSFNEYYTSVVAKTQPYNNKIDRLFITYCNKYKLPQEYDHLQKIINNRVTVFKEENVSLTTQEVDLNNKCSAIMGAMTAVYEGKEQTLVQLNKYLQHNDRKVRQEVWHLRFKRIFEEVDKLNNIFDELRIIRSKQAKNAGYDNYRDFKHKEMGRFAYTPDDVQRFHRSVESAVIPYLKELTAERRQKLSVEEVKPWDTSVDLDGKVLQPFQTVDEFIDKAITALHKVDPKYGLQFNKMKNTCLLDLENRKGKSPGGYNYPLRELGSSYILINAVGIHKDLVTLLHEAGHAMHSFATRPLHLMDYKECPHESAELASMAMEMLTMEYWNEFYSSESDLRKARKDQLQKTLQFLPWCMIVDAFQQWIYTNPNHNANDRNDYFASLLERFNIGVDWQNLDEMKRISWMFQPHIFIYPFYYIEYGIAQLGSLAIYRNYKEKGKEAVKQYDDFLIEGYTKPLDELYKTAGIKFDFSEDYISGLVDFVKKECDELT